LCFGFSDGPSPKSIEIKEERGIHNTGEKRTFYFVEKWAKQIGVDTASKGCAAGHL